MKMILLAILVCIILFSFCVSAANWVAHPSDCPVEYNFVSCTGGELQCGIDGGSAPYCYDMQLLSPPGSNDSSESGDTYQSGLSSGFIVDCEDTDAGEPYCDNSGAFWCNRNVTCRNTLYRQTVCIANTWANDSSSSMCGVCRSSYFQCDGGTTLSSCEWHSGDSCSDSTGSIQYNECFNATQANCTRLSDYLDCDNDDGDNDQLTCNSGNPGNGCEVNPYSTSCAAGNNNHLIDCTNCNCDSGYLDCDASGNDTGNGCEVQDGGSCTVGSLSGTYSGCTCVVDKSYFETGTQTEYQTNTTQAFLWGVDYFVGVILNLSWSGGGGIHVNATGVYFNNTKLGTGGSGGNTTEEMRDAINVTNLNYTINANRTDFWDNYTVTNSTQFENNGGTLNIVWSWLQGLFIEVGTKLGNTTSEIWTVINNNTFVPFGTKLGNTTAEIQAAETDPNWAANYSAHNTTWSTDTDTDTWNTTSEIWTVVNNNTFSKAVAEDWVNESGDDMTGNLTMQESSIYLNDTHRICWSNSSHPCAGWMLRNSSGMYILGG